MKRTQLEKLLPSLLSARGGVARRAGRLLSVLMECASGQMLALSAAHIIHTASQDVTAPGKGKRAGGREDGSWLVYGHANWLVQRQHNHITFYCRRCPTKNATAAASLLYFRGNQIATNSIGRTRLSGV